MVDSSILQADAPNATVSVADFTHMAERACDAGLKGSDVMAKAFPRASRATVSWLCFDLSYMAALLSKGFGLDLSRRASVVKKIIYEGRSFEASWALGMSIKSTKKLTR
eukprot:UN0183